MKYSEAYERDFSLYLRLKDRFTFAGIDVRKKYYKFTEASTGKSAKECFYILDTHGKYEPCFELNLLYEILACKISINLHIKMWADEYREFKFSNKPNEIAFSNLFLDDLEDDYQFPPWVTDAIVKQATKNTNNIFKI